MNGTLHVLGSSALALVLTAGIAQADVTPQQVWQELETYFRNFGYTVSASQSQDGGVLTISNFDISLDLPEGEGALQFQADQLLLTGMGDGTVSVELPAVMPISMQFSAPDEDPFDMSVDYTQDGLVVVVSGTPEDMTYDFTADALGLTLTDLSIDGETLGRDVARGELEMIGLSGRSVVKSGALRDIRQTMAMDEIRYDVAFNDPEGEGSGLFSGVFSDVGFAGSTAFPPDLDMEDPAALIGSNVTASGKFEYAAGTAQFSGTENGVGTAGQTSSDGASLAFAYTGDAITYSQTGKNLSVALSGGDLPFPVTFSMAKSAFNLTLPMAKATEPQEVALGVTLGGFTMSDLLWNIADPAKALPRDPATVAFDITGLVTPFINLFDQDAVEALERSGGVPGELNALTLKNLNVDVAGAKLTGMGDVTFDNSDLSTYDGFPRPEGTLDLQLAGANALLDKLIAMGLMAEQDAMGARMMMSMFTVPGQGQDEVTSTLEFNDKGQILANGQRIK